MRRIRSALLAVTSSLALCAAPALAQSPAPAWPRAERPVRADDAKVEARVRSILSRMSLEQKVGQMIQGEIKAITPEEAGAYYLGSILNGGGSPPDGHAHASIDDWRSLADRFRAESLKGGGVPILWGTDAVHGHNNMFGAVLFPHNIALGAANDPGLTEQIGRAVAADVRSSGIDWAFAPTVAVADNPRWGRTYESFSEDPAIVRRLAEAMVRGLQGAPGAPDQFGADHVIATAKHFIGDGATRDGVDQGDAQVSEALLRDRYAAGYYGAIRADVQTVMASFSSWNGEKMHVQKHLLTDVLKDQMGFDGFVVSDWNAIGQAPGCSNFDCPAAINAGIDMIMAPSDWKAAYESLLTQAKSGAVPLSRIDDAVSRILRVKIRAGLFEEGPPSTRSGAPRTEAPGGAAERDLARQAVRESLVLLKNRGHVLPLSPTSHILVVGEAARSIPQQVGGWSLTWQGSETVNADFPGATSLLAGIEQAAKAAGGQAAFSADGRFEHRPDAAVVVFGEEPYAEGRGDVPDLAAPPQAEQALAIMKRLKAQGVPVVAVLLSGRPLYVSPELNAADAFVAAWLPGAEGEGVADMLFAGPRDFSGRLPFPWPDQPAPPKIVDGRPDHALFQIGYGLTLKGAEQGPDHVAEAPPSAARRADGRIRLYDRGALSPYRAYLGDDQDPAVAASSGESHTPSLSLVVTPADHRVQEDALKAVWRGDRPARLYLAAAEPQDLAAASAGGLSLVFEVRVEAPPAGPVRLGVDCTGACPSGLDLGPALSRAPRGGWVTIAAPLKGLLPSGPVRAPFVLAAQGPFSLEVSDVRLEAAPGGAEVLTR
ncbi:glycoside hydrolase family 3 protein [Phenylobacterium montanum]|uniref:Exo 1,3/1,4-beta-D-glucan glucohydrolase n=1 Tax=Phenylobacterium montanum TaxID=2823693 RepID=A0A975G3G0_9CAUL|nr:glycoside hydrolase family 3 protein [Caulobacter sp. S6]QUD89802.1 exo 1,3/1,4-beta-D-glucan glucohydrolase [Caulobacter sp. S6]